MASDLNRCEFIGRLGANPEVRYAPSGDAVCNFSIAVNYKAKEKENTEWVRIVAFSKWASICADYLKKGSKVFVAGRMTTRKWVNKDGVDQYTTEIIMDYMQMLGGKTDDTPAPKKPDAYRQIKEGNIADLEDDVPF